MRKNIYANQQTNTQENYINSYTFELQKITFHQQQKSYN